jgi:hypothetical protein
MHNMEKCGRGKGRPQGSLRSHRRRRLAPLPPPFSPAPMLHHVVYASLLHFGVESAKSLIPYFRDPRYIRFEGAPLLIVYRPQHLPDARRSAQIWRDYCQSVGIPKLQVYCAFTHGNWKYEQFGFDGGVEFPPPQPGLREPVRSSRLRRWLRG